MSEHFPETKGFSERIIKVINLIGSKEKLGKLSGISATSIRKYELGQADAKRENLIAIADAAKVNVLWLVTGEGPMLRSEIENSHDHQQLNISDNTGFILAVEMLAKIYASGNETLITAIDNNLRAFSETVDAKNIIAAQGNNSIENRISFLERKFTEDLEAIKKSLTDLEAKPLKRGNAAG